MSSDEFCPPPVDLHDPRSLVQAAQAFAEHQDDNTMVIFLERDSRYLTTSPISLDLVADGKMWPVLRHTLIQTQADTIRIVVCWSGKMTNARFRKLHGLLWRHASDSSRLEDRFSAHHGVRSLVAAHPHLAGPFRGRHSRSGITGSSGSS